MGATTFVDYGHGKTAQEAFYNAKDEAEADDWGYEDEEEDYCSSYAGDIRAVNGFREYPKPDDLNAFIETFYDEHPDKWGPCGCVCVKEPTKDADGEYAFFGWAPE